MDGSLKRKLAAGVVAGLAVAGGGAAIAATQLSSPKAENQAIVSDAAKQLGVQPSALGAALKQALLNRVDAAVASGRLTKAEGTALKARIQAGDAPLFGGLRGHDGFDHHGFGHDDDLSAASSYLGVSAADLRTQLESGKTLAQVAKSQGKSVDGLVSALVAAKTKELDAAVTAGRLTKAEEQTILAHVKRHVTDEVNGVRPARPSFAPEGFRRGGSFAHPPGI
jgi:hypothetical protein